MKKLLKFLVPLLIVSSVIAPFASAQVFSPNYWKSVNNNAYVVPINGSSTIGSSTVNGSFKNLNVAGTCTGCGGGSAPGGSSGQVQYNNGGVLAATSTFYVSTSTGALFIQNFESTRYADQYPGADMATKVNNAETALCSGTGGGTIMVPAGQYHSTNDITIAGCPTKLQGQGGGGFYAAGATTLLYDGTGYAYTYNVAGYSSAGVGIFDISLVGPAGVYTGGSTGIGSSTISSSYGIRAGGTNGEFGFNIQGVQVSGFGTALLIYQNASFLNMTNSVLQKNGRNIDNPSVSGANGENMRVSNSIIADSNSGDGISISDKCIDVQQSGNIQWTFSNTSFDDCQVYSNQFGGTANIWNFTDDHFESPNTGQGAYVFVDMQPSAAGSQATVFNFKGGDMMNDFTSNPPNEYIRYGGSLILDGITGDVNNNVAAAVNDFATPLNGGAVISWHSLSNRSYNTAGAPAGFTYVYASTTFSTDGLGFGSTTATYSFSTSTLMFGVNPTDPAGNKYVTSTSGGGLSGLTAGYLTVATSSSAVANSNIYQSLTTPTSTIAFDAASSWVTGASVTSTTSTITVGSGTNRILFAFSLTTNNDASITYNGTSMTLVTTSTADSGRTLSLFDLLNPTSGANLIAVSVPSSEAVVQVGGLSYSGVKQSLTLDAATTTATSTGVTSLTTTLTTVADKDWSVNLTRFGAGSNGVVGAASSTNRIINSVGNMGVFDTNGAKTPPGSQAMTITDSNGTTGAYSIMAAFAPAPLIPGTGNMGFNTTSTTSTITLNGSFGGFASVLSVSSTLSASSSIFQVFAGASPASSTLPRINVSQGQLISFKNRGTATLQIQASSTDFLWQSGVNASASLYLLLPGSSTAFQNDGTYWDQLWK